VGWEVHYPYPATDRHLSGQGELCDLSPAG
jgi:hypothetical protein